MKTRNDACNSLSNVCKEADLVQFNTLRTKCLSQRNIATGETLLHQLCKAKTRKNERLQILHILLSSKKVRDTIDDQCNEGHTALSVNINSHFVQPLICAGANPLASDGKYPFHILKVAAKKGWVKVVKFLLIAYQNSSELKTDALIAACCNSGDNAIHCVIALQDAGAAFLSTRLDITRSSLFKAVCYSTVSVVQWLLKSGAIFRCTSVGRRRINVLGHMLQHVQLQHTESESRRNEAVLDALLAHKGVRALVDSPNNNWRTPLMVTTTIPLARKLVAAGADVNACDENSGMSVLMFETAFCLYPYLLPLVEDINECVRMRSGRHFGWTALHFACSRGHAIAVDHLLKAGADPTLCGKRAATPISLAVKCSSISCVKLLVAAGVNVAADTNLTKYSSFMTCEGGAAAVEVTKFLLLQPDMLARINTPNAEGSVFLMYAKDVIIAKHLVEAGANVNMVHDTDGVYVKGLSVFMQACERHPPDIVAYLLTQCGNGVVHERPKVGRYAGQSILQLTRNVETAKLLIDAGAQVNAIHLKDGRTPLHTAVVSGYVGMARFLVTMGASTTYLDNTGKSPFNLHQAHRHGGMSTFIMNERNVNNYLQSVGRWRPSRHHVFLKSSRNAVVTIHVLARARPRLSLSQLIAFKDSSVLPSRFPAACLHLLPDEVLQYFEAYIFVAPIDLHETARINTCDEIDSFEIEIESDVSN